MNAVISAATKGIGKAIAIKLASEGYNLAICARTATDLAMLTTELSKNNITVLPMVVDCSSKTQVIAFYEKVASVFPTVDILVNNAGVFLPGNMLDEPDEAFEIQQRLNLDSAYYLSKYFGKVMRSQRSGHIFNICSIASKSPVENASSYSVTKTAMLSLNDVLRKELAGYNVKVTAILPGSTLTASWSGTTINTASFVQPEDIADSIAAILKLSSGVNVDQLVLTPLNFNDK